MLDNQETSQEFQRVTDLIRARMLEMFAAFGYGNFSGPFSIVELYAALYLEHLDLDAVRRRPPARTRIVPKSTSALALYPTLRYAGLMDWKRLDCYGSVALPALIHHDIVGVDATPYSLGPNLGTAAGLAMASWIKGVPYQTICFLGDGELQEGVDQAAKCAATLGLNNLTVVVDCNEQQSYYMTEVGDSTMQPDADGKLTRQCEFWSACGWEVVEINGHDHGQIATAYSRIGKTQSPYLILARTKKGKGVAGVEGRLGFNHKVDRQRLASARRHYGGKVSKASAQQIECRHDVPSPPVKRRLDPSVSCPVNVAADGEYLFECFAAWAKRLAEQNRRKVVLINADSCSVFGVRQPESGFSVQQPDCPHVFPGCNERLALAIAKSLAYEGVIPIFGCPAPHMMGAIEEWNAICIDRVPVLAVGTRPGASLADWGPPHTCFIDINVMQRPGGKIFQPSNNSDLLVMLDQLFREPQSNLPAFLRLPDDNLLTPGAGIAETDAWQDGFYPLTGGDRGSPFIAVIATGSMMQLALQFRAQYPHLNVKLINLFNLTAINGSRLRHELRGAEMILSLVEAAPNSIGGLIHDCLEPQQRSVYRPLGIDRAVYVDRQDVFRNGWQAAREFVLTNAGLDTTSLAKIVFDETSERAGRESVRRDANGSCSHAARTVGANNPL